MPFEASHIEVESRFLGRALPAGARVLDAGCGRKTRLERHRERIAELVGVDLDPHAGAENTALDQFLVADLNAPLLFEDDSFDLVYANFVIEHLTSPATALTEWRRVLRPEGSLVLLTTNSANPAMAVARLLPHRARVAVKGTGAGEAQRDVIPAVYRANAPGRLAAVIEQAGLVPVEVAYVANLHGYARRMPALAKVLLGFERVLPEKLRSTIVGWYRPA
jgi:ubiquinone/menaquinone biosynthesis C-methylase UbiE